jgi:hypothetical protein
LVLAIGTRVENTGLRLQSYALAVLTFGRTLLVNFDLDGVFAGVPSRILITAAVVAAFFAAEFRPCATRPKATRASIDGSRRRCALLSTQVSGRLLTVAWGIQDCVIFAGLLRGPDAFAIFPAAGLRKVVQWICAI